jgi:hypothetical protein
MILNRQIIKQIKEKSGLLLDQAKDFSLLADKIFSETGRNIGVTTLKRLLGTINDSRKTNEYTLNTIAQYLGYATWQRYTEANSIDSVWNFNEEETFYVHDMAIETTFTVQYLNREVAFIVMEQDGQKVLKVISAKNSSLQKNDILFVHKIKVGEALQADKVVRGGNIGNYRTNGEVFEINMTY